MTHLHFDHCGGSIQWNKDRTGYEPAFKNATFLTNENHWKWATEPNVREKASFLKENLLPMQESGQLQFVKRNNTSFVERSELGFGILFLDGHTEKQMIPHINYKGKTLVFMADLMPTVGHIPLAYVTGYDTRPLLSMDEKAMFIKKAIKNEYVLFFEHDAHNELCSIKNTEKGARLNELFTFKELFS